MKNPATFRTWTRYLVLFTCGWVAVDARAGTVDRAEFCASGEEFRYAVEVSSIYENAFDMIVRIYLVGDFVGAVADNPNQNIGYNIDRLTCEVTRLAPTVRSEFLLDSEKPLVDGRIDPSRFTLTPIRPGTCLFEGSVDVGENPLQPGDVVPEVWYREGQEGSPTINARANDVPVTECLQEFTIGGTVTGLTGSGLVLQNNGGDDLEITGNGPFTFARAIGDGAAYAVTVLSQPRDPRQVCSVSAGAGTVDGANVEGVSITCEALPTGVFKDGFEPSPPGPVR